MAKKAEIDKSFVVLIIAVGFVIGGLIAIPISNFLLGDNGTKFDANGQIGDFVGGLLNPVIALLALIWVRRGVQSQEKELMDSKEALRLSAEAQTKQVKISAITAIVQVELFKEERLKSQLDGIEAAIQRLSAELPFKSLDQMARDSTSGRISYTEKRLEELRASRNSTFSEMAAVQEKIISYGLELSRLGGDAR